MCGKLHKHQYLEVKKSNSVYQNKQQIHKRKPNLLHTYVSIFSLSIFFSSQINTYTNIITLAAK